MADARPNVLVIMSDEHDPRVSQPYGHPFVRTPNMQPLFAAMFPPASVIVCEPAIAVIVPPLQSPDVGGAASMPAGRRIVKPTPVSGTELELEIETVFGVQRLTRTKPSGVW